jgi:hypothetical protein
MVSQNCVNGWICAWVRYQESTIFSIRTSNKHGETSLRNLVLPEVGKYFVEAV